MTTKRQSVATFPARLVELRQRAGLTRAQLAAAAETSEGAVCHLELGRRAPSMYLAGRLAVALGVSVDALYCPTGSPVSPIRKGFEIITGPGATSQ